MKIVNKCDLYNYADDNTLSKSDNTLETVIESLEEDSRSLMSWFAFNKMQANPDKFQSIAIGNKTHKQNIVFDLNGSKINCDDEVKLLGITIDFKLDFNKHISNICKKAARQLNVLKRIGSNLGRLAKLTIYHSFILSNLREYDTVARADHCFAEYCMLFLRRRGNEHDIFEIALDGTSLFRGSCIDVIKSRLRKNLKAPTCISSRIIPFLKEGEMQLL